MSTRYRTMFGHIQVLLFMLLYGVVLFALNMSQHCTTKHEVSVSDVQLWTSNRSNRILDENLAFQTIENQNKRLSQKLLNTLNKKETELHLSKNSQDFEETSILESQNTLQRIENSLKILSSKTNDILNSLTKSSQSPLDGKSHVENLLEVKKCKKSTVLFLVTSHSSNKERRKTIRNNWGDQDKFMLLKSHFNLTYEVYFSVGLADNPDTSEKIHRESIEHKDILIVNRHEDFYDLTRRVMSSFDWSINNCEFEYLFKVDDDIFVNIPNVFSFLTRKNVRYLSHLYAGDMNIEAIVNRNPKSKYRVSYKEWPVETYPPYCSGGGFIISRDIVKSIIPYFDWVNPLKIDDVYIGILIERAKLKNIKYYLPEDLDMFWFYSKPEECKFKSSTLIYHKVNDDECMTSLTNESTKNISSILENISEQFSKNSASENAPMQQLARHFSKDKLPSLEDIPKASSPMEARKKKALKYLIKRKTMLTIK